MGDAVVAALVAGVVSLLVTFGKLAWDARQARQNERSAARDRLDRYRAPLLASVHDLGGRLENIRNTGFLVYLEVERRRDTALKSTLFRLGQFFGWTEIIYGYSDRLRFESDEATRAVADTLAHIGWVLASDEFDRTDENDFTTSQLMLWREEQRAIGELMRQETNGEIRCLGFNSFMENYEDQFASWFESFALSLQLGSAPAAHRLAELQRALAKLVRQIDVDQVLVQVGKDGQITEPGWAQSSTMESTRPAGDSST